MPNPSISRFRKLQAEAQALLDEKDIALHAHRQLSRAHKFAAFTIRVYKSYVRNRCLVRAAALAYTSVLALVPLIAVGASVYAGFLKSEGEAPIRHAIDQLVANVAPMLGLEMSGDAEEAAITRAAVVNQIYQFVGNINSGALQVSALLALVFLAISLLTTIEATFNDMWGVSEGRSLVTRVAAYWAAVTLGPLFLATALGITGAGFFQETKAWIEQVEFIRTLVQKFLLPFFILSLVLSSLYLLLPNTKVNWGAALCGGCVGGFLLQLNNLSTFLYASQVKSYTEIYKGLSVVPLFLFGLYVSWIIVLLGAQVAYAFQNRRAYVQEKVAENVNQRGREFVAFRLMTRVAQRFHASEKPPSGSAMADEMGIPLRLASQLLSVLVEARLLVEVAGVEIGYAPARPLSQITAQNILDALRSGKGQELETTEDPAKLLVRQEFNSIRTAETAVAGTLTLESLVERLKAATKLAEEDPVKLKPV